MRAITIHRPWSDAIVHGSKRIENRSWVPPRSIMGMRIAIHAGKTHAPNPGLPDGYAAPPQDECPTGIVGVATVSGYLDLRDQNYGRVHGVDVAAGVWRSRFELRDHDLNSDPWWVGPVGWVLEDVIALPEPVRIGGKQGLWTVLPQVVEGIERQLDRIGKSSEEFPAVSPFVRSVRQTPMGES